MQQTELFIQAIADYFDQSVATASDDQLFAAGYSACFIGAMKFVAGQSKQTLPADLSLRAEVGIGKIEGGFGLDVDLFINLPGMDSAAAQELVNKAHHVCPYSNATRGNVDVRLHVNV